MKDDQEIDFNPDMERMRERREEYIQEESLARNRRPFGASPFS